MLIQTIISTLYLEKKTTRFVSVEEGSGYKAAEIENKNPAIEKQPALPFAVVRDLKRVADAISEQYSTTDEVKPMDMEYTVKLKDKGQNTPTIYLLQARPLQKMNTQSNPPSYLQLDDCEVAPAENKVMVQTLLDGQSYIRTVTNSEDVLFVDDLKEALKAYFKKENPQNIKAIIVRKSAPSTSHESVVLRARGVLVYVADSIDEYNKAEALIKSTHESNPVLLDPQRGLIIRGLSVDAINSGHISYPIPLEVSVPPTQMMMKGLKLAQAKDPVEKKALLDSIIGAFPAFNKNIKESIHLWSNGQPLLEVKNKNSPNGHTLRSLLELMATRESKEAKLAFATLIDYLDKNLAAQMKSSSGVIAGANIPKFMVLETLMEMADREIIPALENKGPQTLERLFHLKFVDALIFQRASKEVVSGFSYGMSTVTTAKEASLINELKLAGINTDQLTEDQLFAYSLKNKIWSHAVQTKWISFVQHLDPKGLETCKVFFKNLNKLNMESTYLNLIFKNYATEKNPKALVTHVLKEIQAEANSNPDMKSRLEKNMVRLTSAENQIEQWKKAKHVVKNFASFKKEFEKDFLQLVSDYAKATKFEKLALLEGASRAVDIYDRTIKSLKENPEFATDQEKVRYFAELLEGYKGMMGQVLKLVSVDNEYNLMKPSMGSMMSFKDYQTNLEKGHSYKFGFTKSYNHTGFNSLLEQARQGKANLNNLEARSEFAVDSLVIGSKADLAFSVHWPDRLEEYFTTFHQNMEKAIQHMRMSQGLTKDVLPDFAKPMVNDIEHKFGVKISQIRQENNGVKIYFNIPLRQHAGALTLTINPKNPEKGMQLEGRMFGNDEHERWDQAASFFSYLAYSDPKLSLSNNIGPDIDYTKIPVEGVGFSLQIAEGYTKQSQLLDKIHYIYKSLTMAPIGDSSHLVTRWGDVDWANLSEELSSHALYANGHILSVYDSKGWSVKKALVAEQSLLSMAKKELSDYKKGKAVQLPNYIGASEYAHIPGNVHNYKGTTSLLLIAVMHLIKADKENAAVRPIIERILTNLDVQKAFPIHIAALAKATKSSSQIFEDSLVTGDFKRAIDQIENLKKDSNIKIADKENYYSKMVKDSLVNTVLVSNSAAEITALYEKLGNTYKGFDFVSILLKAPALTAEDKLHLEQKIKQAEVMQQSSVISSLARQKLKEDIDENIGLLLQSLKISDFPITVQTSADVLIGLAQHNDFSTRAVLENFVGLEDFAGSFHYSYIPDNIYATTTKVRKAAPLYLVKALQSYDASVREYAYKGLGKLINDYETFHAVKPMLNSHLYLKTIVGICKGHFSSPFANTSSNKQLFKDFYNKYNN